MKVINDEGVEMEVHTTEELEAAKSAEAERVKVEYEAKLADKDAHMKTKLDEFLTGQKTQEQKDTERDTQIAEAKRLAESAEQRASATEQRRLDAIKEIAMSKFVGNDPELRAKFEESWSLVNLEIKDDSDIAKKAEMVANMAGLNTPVNQFAGGMNMGAGFAPVVSAAEKAKNDDEYNKFKNVLGIDFGTEDKK